MVKTFLTNRDPGDENDYKHDEFCHRQKDWPMCCGTQWQIEDHYDESFGSGSWLEDKEYYGSTDSESVY